MSGFPIIDLVVGMIFIYFLLSIISSSLVEIILSYFKIRSRVLEQWLYAIFDQKMIQPNGTTPKLGQAIMDHAITAGLTKAGKATSFMDAKNFVSSLLEKVTFDPNQPDKVAKDLDGVITAISNSKAVNGTPLLTTELQRAFLMYAYDAKDAFAASTASKVDGVAIVSEMQLFREKLENWFDSSMDRIQGRMKTKFVRPITLCVGTVLVLALNADTIAISRYLYNNPEARARLAEKAYETGKDTLRQKQIDTLANAKYNVAKEVAENFNEEQKQIKKEIATLKETGIPLGWDEKDTSETLPTKLAGWAASILAIMLGAPFWFDLLNKIANIRGAGSKPPSTTDKEKKDK